MKVAFVDTMVLLHYRAPYEADWRDVLSAPHVRFVVPNAVVTELDHHKHEHERKRIRERAASVLKRLSSIEEDGPPAGLPAGCEVTFEDCDAAWDYRNAGLDPNLADNRILGSALAFAEANPEDEVVLLTAEMSLRMKARRLGLTALEAPETFALPVSPDPDRERIEELERELRELRDRIPRLRLAFASGEDHARFRMRQPRPWSAEDLSRLLGAVRRRHPFISEPVRDVTPAPPGVGIGIAAILRATQHLSLSPQQITEYNEKVGAFHGAYEAYLRGPLAAYRAIAGQVLRLRLSLVNEGTASGDDMHVVLHIPDGIAVYDRRRRPRMPRPPEPPQRPVSLLESLTAGPDLRYAEFPRLSHPAPAPRPPPNVSPPQIRPGHSTEVVIEVRTLKHSMEVTLHPLWLAWDSFEQASSFSAAYRIIAGNVPMPVGGQLHVIVDKSE